MFTGNSVFDNGTLEDPVYRKEEESEIEVCADCGNEADQLCPLGIDAYGLRKSSMVCTHCLNNLHGK